MSFQNIMKTCDVNDVAGGLFNKVCVYLLQECHIAKYLVGWRLKELVGKVIVQDLILV